MPIENRMGIEELIGKRVLEELQKSAARIMEEEIEAAAERVKQRIRERVGEVAVVVANQVSFQRLGSELVIHVKIQGS